MGKALVLGLLFEAGCRTLGIGEALSGDRPKVGGGTQKPRGKNRDYGKRKIPGG